MKHAKEALALTLALTLLTGSAGAYTVKRLQPEELYSETLLEKLSTSDWAAEEVYQAQVAGLVTSRTSSYFTANITRLQFAELVSNMVELTLDTPLAPAADAFPDTDDKAVLQAAGAGIVTGLPDGTFGGDKLITRQEICVMLDRAIAYLEAQGKPAPSNSGSTYPSDFEDWDQVGEWAADAAEKMVRRGLMNGTSGTTISPLGNTTVEQAIILIYRLYLKY